MDYGRKLHNYVMKYAHRAAFFGHCDTSETSPQTQSFVSFMLFSLCTKAKCFLIQNYYVLLHIHEEALIGHVTTQATT